MHTLTERTADTVLPHLHPQCPKVGARRDDQVLYCSRSLWVICDGCCDAVLQRVGVQLGTTAVLAARAHGALSRLVDYLPGFAAVIRRIGRQSLASLGASLFSGRVVWSCFYRCGRETARCVRIFSLAFKVLAPRFGWAPSGVAYYFVDSPLNKVRYRLYL